MAAHGSKSVPDDEGKQKEEDGEELDEDEGLTRYTRYCEMHKKMMMKKKRKRESFELDDYETKRLETAPRDADDVGHEYSGSGKGASTAEEVQLSLYGPVEDIPEEDQQLEAEEPQDLNDEDDGMAHSTSDEEELDLEEDVELVNFSERYKTDEDNRIIKIDIPERMQLSEASTGTPPTDDDSIVKEAKWIKEQFKSGQVPGQIVLGDDMEEHIKNFLKFSHVERLDLPYIAMYRKEDISCLLKDKDPETGEDVSSHDKPALKRHKVLWAVHDLDRKWLLLQKRKTALQGDYDTRFETISCRIDDKTRYRFNRQVYESIISALRLAESERELDDVDSKFNLHFPPGEVGVDKTYRICKEAGLWKFASKFGYSSEQLVDEMEDPKETPEDVASNFTCESFNSVEAVLMHARFMASVDLSHEPRVKNHFRSKYFDNAVVSTCSISGGNAVIDDLHQSHDKPLSKFEDEEWLLIQEAEENELLQVTIKLPKENHFELISEFEKLYLSVSVSELAQLWNVQRKKILEDAINCYILPALEKEARLLLTNRAKNRLLLDYGKLLWDKVSVAPYQPKKRESSSDDEAAPRVMACCWGSGKSPTTFVMLDPCGDIDDVLEAESTSSGILNAIDKLSLEDFVIKHQPQVVVVGVVNFSCIRLMDNIHEIVIDLYRDKRLGCELDRVRVVSGDESLSRQYVKSSISYDQIPFEAGHVKRAVALGRYLQNPLAMVANLCAPSTKVLSWKLSPLERFLNADEKSAMVEQIMVDVTNQVGIDLNLAANNDWLFAPMQFISGLGPRKAAALERSLSGAAEIGSREELSNHGLETKVYNNAAGFLRIRRGGLDDTRIHPESYILAQEMVKYIYKKFVSDDDVCIEMAIKNLRDDLSAWKAFDVDAYAKGMDRLSKAETLRAIKLELIQGFQDWRKPYEIPTSEEEFFMIYGAKLTVDVGQTVEAIVRSVKADEAICELVESKLTGVLLREDFSDDWSKLQEGQTLPTCKINCINKTWYRIYLTCRENDMRNIGHQNVENLDPEEDQLLEAEEPQDLNDKGTKSLKMAPRDAVDVGHEYSGSGKGASTAEEVQRSLYGDDAGPVEDIPEEDQQLEAEEPQDLNDEDDGMAHSTSEEELDLEEDVELVNFSERYKTDEDNRIIKIDIPERMQLSEASTGTPPTDDDSIVKEAKWIKEQFKSGQVPGQIVLGDDMEEHIKNFLKFSHVERLDLPYIAMYRKEDISCLLKDKDPETGEDVSSHDKPALKRHKVLWAVHDLDRKWLLLQKRKTALQGDYDTRFETISCRIDDETRYRFNRQVYESIISALRLAESERELDDVDSKFNLHFPPGEVGVDKTYRICKEAGLWKFASKFGYSSEQLVDEMEDPKETPEDVASNFTCESFNSVEAVLMHARFMASVDLSHEPRVKNHFRSKYFDNAVVSTCSISGGNAVIDDLHQSHDKPLSKFEDEEWLLIQEAEENELLQVTIKLPKENHFELISEFEKLYLSVSVSELAQLWNVHRKKILEDSISYYILPALEKEARLLLTNRAKNWLLLDYGKLLWDKVSVAPYKPKKRESSSDDEAAPRVMACCWGSGKPPTTFVMLDSYGEIVDVLESQSMSSRILDTTDKLNLELFMIKYQPQVVVVGVVNFSCIRLEDAIYEIVIDLFRAKRLGCELDWVSVISGDESLSRLYVKSSISYYQIPCEAGYVKRAAALGRYLQNPLAMVANLCAPSTKVLSWKLSPLERFLNADEKSAMVEQIMVDVTNQVGIDLNLAANHDWLFAPMQFISGLGPRKAAALERSLSRAEEIGSREELLSHGLRTKVYHNAAGFLRIRRRVLDDTRIHPESYNLAEEMVEYIYKEFVSDDDVEIEMAIKNLRDDLSAWKAFDVDAYAKGTDCLSKAKTLRAIKLELIQGFQDWRKPYEDPTSDEEFFMIYGANLTVVVGQTVKAIVRSVKADRAICELVESGLTGVLLREDLSDDWRDVDSTGKLQDWRDVDLTGKLQEGQTLPTCKIKWINMTWYRVYLTCRENDMRNIGHQNVEKLDPYYHEDRSSLSSEQDKARRGKDLAEYS